MNIAGERLPRVGALNVLVTFVVPFLMTGSVRAPVDASVLNRLSLTVVLGVLVGASGKAASPGGSGSPRPG